MRKFLLSLLLLAGVTTTANLVFAGDAENFPNGREPLYHGTHSSISKYSGALSGQSTYGDSTYIGYSPGNGSAANAWSIRASTTNSGTNNVHRPPKAGCMWNWDPEEAGGNGYINGYTIQPQNVAEYRTAGLDLNVNYAVRTGRFGDIDLRFVGGYLHRLTQIATPGAQSEDQVDQIGRPKFNFVFSPTWTLDRITISYNLRWVDAMRRFPKQATDNSPDYAPAALLRYDEVWQHDVQAQVAVNDAMSFYGGVNNVGDQRPGVDAVDQPISPLGRYFYAGARVRFGR